MQRLGYTKYVAQGGDWGNAVSEVMALQQPPGLLGIHTNMAATVPPDDALTVLFRALPLPAAGILAAASPVVLPLMKSRLFIEPSKTLSQA